MEPMPPATARAMRRALLLDDLRKWHRLVRVEADRVLTEEDFKKVQDESTLFALALRGLLRVADAARQFGSGRANKAKAAFLESVPHAVHVRNVLEHFDKYGR